MSALADLITTHWLAATDDSGEDRIESVTAEEGYRLGFGNALQVVGQAQGDPRLDAAIAEAMGLLQE
jgi:hypothetical protein